MSVEILLCSVLWPVRQSHTPVRALDHQEEGPAAWGLQNSDKEIATGFPLLLAASLHSVSCVRKFKLNRSEPLTDKSGFSLRADRQATS